MLSISYLLTSNNNAAHLRSVLASISREQSITGGEIIIVDDGSTDGSIDMCQRFAATHPSTTFVQQDNKGIYAALNRAIPLAKGRWLRLCDCDDPLIIHSTKYLMEIATNECANIAYGQAINYGPSPLTKRALNAVRPISHASVVLTDAITDLIQAVDFTTSCAIYRTEQVKRAMPLPEHLISSPEFALAVRAAATGRVVKLREPVCYYRATVPQSDVLARHQTIRILQSSRGLLQRRHRIAALAEFNKWSRDRLRGELYGWRFGARRMKLRLMSAATRLGLYNWHSALDAFARMYEAELVPVLRKQIGRH
jgi:glycosyltransferase involved in cell wall biosynthesis